MHGQTETVIEFKVKNDSANLKKDAKDWSDVSCSRSIFFQASLIATFSSLS